MSKKLKTGIILFGCILLLLVIGPAVLYQIFNFKLQQALGFISVYKTNLIITLLTAFLSALVICIVTLFSLKKIPNTFLRVVFGVIGFIFGYSIGQINPTSWLLFFNHQHFGKTDPIYHLDYSFFVYQLPGLQSLLGKIVGIIIYFIVIKGLQLVITYFIKNNKQFKITKTGQIISIIDVDKDRVYLPNLKTIQPILKLGGLLFLTFAVEQFLTRYSILYNSQEGNFLYGPGFADTHFTIPVAILINCLLLLFISTMFFIYSFKTVLEFRVPKTLIISIVSAIVVSILLILIKSGINGFYVHPNQVSAESPYIQRTIEATRWGFQIENIKTKSFNPSTQLSDSDINQNQNLISNVRINDIGQTKDIYNQLQSFKNYFVFNDASDDRYNGQQVYIDARQMDVTKLPVQTWINQNIVYTHGYGIAASHVNHFNSDGLPIEIAKDTPVKTSPPLPKVTQPNIYFGTMDNNVIAPTTQGEFDYPSGDTDHTSHYKGGYGLPIKGNQLILTLETGTLKYFTSNQFTDKSQYLFDRNIYKRVKDIAPFLTYEKDAYPFVSSDGRIQWMLDAYTKTANIPYGEKFSGVNYQRNSVKVVMDAYTGKVTFYVVDSSDPMIKSLMKIYPSLFTTKIPNDVRAHFLYPKQLFDNQSKAIASYHMTDPTTFYNKVDLWDLAQEIYKQNETATRPSVYQILQMPGNSNPSFVLSQLFTPNNKMNLNGWLVAGNDPSEYGHLTLYQFPESTLFFGPMQAENQIDSDPTVSSQLTLWNQQGSHVVRGNLLLVPIGNAAIYIEPVYLVADRNGSLPQLQRVIVNFNKKVYMDNSLADALRSLVADISGGTSPNTTSNQPSTNKNEKVNQLAEQANTLLNDYKTQTANGNFEKAGKDLEQIGQLIQQMMKTKK
ncbi:MAG: UPF0182 family protein [Bacillota bacterium]|nr:UPF0182 family protein [Bacillota bacterium]